MTDPHSPPPAGTIERWAFDYVVGADLASKLAPPPPPARWEDPPVVRRLAGPGRPPELRVIARAPRAPTRGALVHARRRAELLHTFLHHELQAAELMAWALLAFADAPRAFRSGLLRVCRDEIRHVGVYRAEIERLGARVGDFGVRDWFWQRVPACRIAVEFVALFGIGLEGANLDHAERYVEWFAAAGDPDAARAQALVGREEVEHVRFAVRWFREWTGGVDFDAWTARLPAPVSAAMLRGRDMNRRDRVRAGLSEEFLARFDARHGDAPVDASAEA